ncbi:MAG: YggS family pyridoxal phosphate-dependent enzyme [Verrucomicrobiota bacterium]
MVSYNEFFENLSGLRDRIDEGLRKSGRAVGSVCLLPVTKNHPPEAVEFCHRAEIHRVGENRVQEASGKKESLDLDEMKWDLIGHLQSNKAGAACRTFDCIQSVDSLKLGGKINRFLEGENRKLACLLQVNTGEDPGKFGFTEEETRESLNEWMSWEALEVEGLMTIAPLEGGRDAAVKAFARLRCLRDELSAASGLPLKELSMGMSGDLEEAIREGSTMVRVGSALFGERFY